MPWAGKSSRGEILSPLTPPYVPFGIRRFNITSKHDAHCNGQDSLRAPFFGTFHCFQIMIRSLVLKCAYLCHCCFHRSEGIVVNPPSYHIVSFPFVYLPDLRTRVTVAFWTSLSCASLSAVYALYQVSVRQATISLSLLLAYTSRCKPWESLWGSSATTPLVDFHHSLTTCPSYTKNRPDGGFSLNLNISWFLQWYLLRHPHHLLYRWPALPSASIHRYSCKRRAVH